ncbi:lysylphosphatidylglycerol synthase transmembrane domain-containing protein [Actinoplanes subtropicus]|uniref:lysylphosphatidylglycerol synthase transmembrane domain-containing protein n=1 Tax=Actinoplanes subtropicus TaxID=543632 RepID=UPI001FE1DA2E|nr:YbhN family protein [Actinoplanes subtropicus]
MTAVDSPIVALDAASPAVDRRRWLRLAGIAAVVVLFGVELVLGWHSLSSALRQLRTPHLGWLALATVAELVAMNAYGRMQRYLLRSAGVHAPLVEHLRLAYAAHSLSATLPGGPAFSTRFNYQQMRRFGATPAIASWCIALSGILSACALAVVTLVSALAAGGVTHWQHLAALLVAGVLLTLGVRRVARDPDTVRPLIRLVNRLRRRPETDGDERIRGFLEQLRAARLRPGHGAAAALYALANWFLDALCLWLCFRAVGVTPAGLPDVLLAFCAAMAAGTITIVPGGLGIIDSALILGLIASGVHTTAAVAAVVLYRPPRPPQRPPPRPPQRPPPRPPQRPPPRPPQRLPRRQSPRPPPRPPQHLSPRLPRRPRLSPATERHISVADRSGRPPAGIGAGQQVPAAPFALRTHTHRNRIGVHLRCVSVRRAKGAAPWP